MRRTVFGINKDDVTVYLKKTGITDVTTINALHAFYSDLKLNNLWSKIKVLYPMLGGTSFTTKFDLVKKNNSFFDISWNGSPIFTVNGVNGGAGLNAYGNTKFNPSINSITGNEGYTTCVGTNDADISSDPIQLGTFRSDTTSFSLMTIRTTGLNFTARLNSSQFTMSNATKLGIYSINRKVNVLTMFKNGTKLSTNTTGSTAPNSNIYLLNAANGAGPYSGYATGRMQCTIFHEGLTDLEQTTLHGLINTFENSLGRKTW